MIDDNRKKRICIFSHYFLEDHVPFYVILYLNELAYYFDEILLVTNTRNLRNEVLTSQISVLMVTNEGYDLGMFYKGIQQLKIDEYRQIAFINDSNILFGRLNHIFEWAQSQKVDFWGLVDSYQRPKYSTHAKTYHIQSHFIVFNETAIIWLLDYFNKINFAELTKECDIRKLKKKVINDWEIGVTQFLLSKGLTCKTYIDSLKYQQIYKKKEPVNISLRFYPQTIKNGIPIIKKRVITSTQLRHVLSFNGNWKRLIRKYGNKNFETDRLIDELKNIRRETLKVKFIKFFKRR